jgi:long-chain acyl-CoA synthetase
MTQALSTWQPASKSVIAAIMGSCREFAERPAFVYRVSAGELTVSYVKLREDVVLLVRALRERRVSAGSRVLLLSDNRYAWMVTDLALMALGAVSVPRGSDTPSQELAFILDHAACTFLIVETHALLSRHEEVIGRHKEIRSIFLMEGTETHTLFSKLYSYNDILSDRSLSPADFKEFDELVAARTPDELVSLIYTSGTTGQPKGVMLNHANILYNIELLPPLVRLRETDLWVSILPSWHIFERAAEYVALHGGSCTVYSSLKTFAADLIHYRPTVVATVPRLWEALYGKVVNAVAEQGRAAFGIFRLLVRISARFRRARRRLAGNWPQFRKAPWLVRVWWKLAAACELAVLALPYAAAQKKLAPLRQKFGGRLRMAISGGGSLPAYLEVWLDAIGLRIANAYGMTECAPAIAGRGFNSEMLGTLGPPLPATQVRIVDSSGLPVEAGVEGEVEVKGPQVFPGYYNDDEENRKAFTADGFFRTGDLGRLTLSGELVLTGRCKEIIVLASGENIDPSRIEGAIGQLPFVADAVLVGQDRKGLAALIVPDWEKLKDFVVEKFGERPADSEDLDQDPNLRERVRKEINRMLHAQNGFKPYEKLQKIDFLKKEFTVGEELTNTMKKKRHVIEQKYREVIDRLFS